MLLLYVLCLFLYSGLAAVQPTYDCWFTTDGSMPTIVLGYANIDPVETIINVTYSSDTDATNVLIPLSYNGVQPTLFETGSHPLTLAIHLYDQNDTIKWNINGLLVLVSPLDLTPEKRCFNSVYASRCPTSITDFCNDGSYCNGNEICFPDVMGGPTGVCHHTTEIIVCETSDLVCNDTLRACAIPVTLPPPTVAPTEAPTQEPTTEAIVTETPTLLVLPPRNTNNNVPCKEDIDCEGVVRFCTGSHVCNQLTSMCIPADTNFDPCYNYRTSIRDYYALTNKTISPVSVTCLEQERHCTESLTCQTNRDCSDNLRCNGVEQCIDNQCYYQEDQSTSAVCQSSIQMACNETHGCFPIEELLIVTPTMNHTHSPLPDHTISPIVIGIAIGILVLTGLVILLCVIYFEFNTGDSFTSSMDIGKQLIFSSKMRGNFGRKIV